MMMNLTMIVNLNQVIFEAEERQNDDNNDEFEDECETIEC